MARPEKVQAVADIKDRLQASKAVFIAEYAGLSVAEQQQLRRGLRAADSEFKVVKMTLARRAVQELGHDGLLALLVGPSGLAFADGDAAASAKALRDFSRDHEALIIKGALLGGEVLLPERVGDLADLEPREVLLSKVAGAFQAPMAKLARLLAALPGGFASALKQLVDKRAELEPKPAAEAAPAADPEASAEPTAPDVEPGSAGTTEGENEALADTEVGTVETIEDDPAPTAEASTDGDADASADAAADNENKDETAATAEED